MESILNIECSMFASAKETGPATVNLLQWLTSDKYLPQQQKVRAATDPETKQKAKKVMPSITPSGLFSKRGKKYLLRHTGLIAIDIDLKENTDVTNFHNLKKEICKIPDVAYCGLSVSGTGYWLLIPILHPEKHEQHFEFIRKNLKIKNLIIDKACSDVARLRFYSYDPEAYFNHTAKPLQAYYTPPAIAPKQSYQKQDKVKELTESVYNDAVNWVAQKSIEFIDGQKHNYIFHLCSYLQSKGVEKEDAENWINENLMPLSEIHSNCITYPYANFTAGKKTEAKPQHQPAPVQTINPPAPAQTFINQVLSKQIAIDEPLATTLSLEQLQAMAISHFNKYPMFKDKATVRDKYFKAWANDMAAMIQAAGSTQQQFLNSLNI